MCPAVHATITTITYGRRYDGVLQLEWDGSLLADKSWLASSIRHFFGQDLGNSNSQFFYSTKHALELIVKSPMLLSIGNTALEKVTTTHIQQFYGRLESALRQSEHSDSNKHRTSASFRRVCTTALAQLIPRVVSGPRSINYKSTLLKPRKASSLLSDSVIIAEGNPIDPVGALPHSNYNDLYEKTKQRITSDLDRLKRCCHEDMIYFAEVRRKLVRIESIAVPAALLELVKEQVFSHDLNLAQERRRSIFSDEQIIAAHLKVQKETGADRLLIKGFNYFKFDGIMERTFGEYKKYFKTPRTFFELPSRCICVELLSILILLLCHTGWNIGSLLNMGRSQIMKAEGHWKIQGFKTKTDDYTPQEYFSFSEKDVNLALSTLTWHHDSIISLGLIGTLEDHLWFAGRDINSYSAQGIGIVSRKLFYERHNLPPFSFGEIRNQVFEKNRLDGRNLDSIRRKAGHKHRNTTVGYLDSIVSRRLFSSLNLEFSRRLENTIIFRLNSTDLAKEIPYDSSLVREGLFAPTGDGTYCIDSSKPPDGYSLLDNTCAALDCHKDGGCPNRKIIIDAGCLEDLVRKKNYYVNNWARLESNNPAAFKRFHFDSIVFVLTLYDYIRNSSYREFLFQAEQRIRP